MSLIAQLSLSCQGQTEPKIFRLVRAQFILQFYIQIQVVNFVKMFITKPLIIL